MLSSSMDSAPSKAKTVRRSWARRVAMCAMAACIGSTAGTSSPSSGRRPSKLSTASTSGRGRPSSRRRAALARTTASPSSSSTPRTTRSISWKPDSGTSRAWRETCAMYMPTSWPPRRSLRRVSLSARDLPLPASPMRESTRMRPLFAKARTSPMRRSSVWRPTKRPSASSASSSPRTRTSSPPGAASSSNRRLRPRAAAGSARSTPSGARRVTARVSSSSLR